ncbi:hypothetical protein CDL15_Pgr025787 [Punica granatum]|uniref:Uncharacterized protein n=1 Tax=Punica granatum TaxID=22663 RepID=A0A218WBV2_PUNGR|nr:hypothetical protein CDL15_Pgr025787 [Punica granatum]
MLYSRTLDVYYLSSSFPFGAVEEEEDEEVEEEAQKDEAEIQVVSFLLLAATNRGQWFGLHRMENCGDSGLLSSYIVDNCYGLDFEDGITGGWTWFLKP